MANDKDTLREEYDFSEGRRGIHHQRYHETMPKDHDAKSPPPGEADILPEYDFTGPAVLDGRSHQLVRELRNRRNCKPESVEEHHPSPRESDEE